MNTWHSKIVAVVVGILALSPGAHAGQGQFYSASGKPYIWPNGTISWVSDSGALSKSCDNACAVKMITDAFAVWSSAGLQKDATSGTIPTADITSIHKGQNSEDVTAANYKNYVNNTNLPPTFIFDEDGSILKEVCKNVGCLPEMMSQLTMLGENNLDMTNTTIKHGVVILNGPLYDKIGKDMFFASLVHGMGELLGLDFSGVGNTLVSGCAYGPCTLPAGMEQALPTMYPMLLTSSMKDLHKDDVVAISSLYPKGDVLTSQFCTITGKITDAAGKGIQGLQVEALAFGTVGAVTDAVSTMTGVNYPIPTNDGHYTIRGIVPQQKYSVAFTQLPTFGKSTVSPIGHWYNSVTKVTTNSPKLGTPVILNADPDICPPGFPGCAITAVNGSMKTVSCDKGGQTIVMDPVKLNAPTIDSQYASAPTPSTSDQSPNTWYYWREGKVYTEHGCTIDYTEMDAAGKPMPWRATKTIDVYFEGKENGSDWMYESGGKCKPNAPWFYSQKNGKLNDIANGFALPGNSIAPLLGATIINDTQKWCPTKTASVYVSGKHLGTNWQYCTPEEVKYYSNPNVVVTSTMSSYDLAKCDPDGNGSVAEAIQDPNLLKAIQKELGTTQITVAQAEKMTVIESKDLTTTLEGLQCFPGLTIVTAYGKGDPNSFKDLGPLSGLKALKGLRVENSQVADLTPLAGLKGLETLMVNNSKVEDLTPLAGLTQLDTLYLAGNKIKDLKPLSGLEKLSELQLWSNPISDIKPLTKLKSLGFLGLIGITVNGGKIADFGPLSEMTNLVGVNLRMAGISDLTPLAKLTKLEDLDLVDNPIKDITPLLGIASSKLDVTLPNPPYGKIPEVQIQKLKATGAKVSFWPQP